MGTAPAPRKEGHTHRVAYILPSDVVAGEAEHPCSHPDTCPQTRLEAEVRELREGLEFAAVGNHVLRDREGAYAFEDCPDEACAHARSLLAAGREAGG